MQFQPPMNRPRPMPPQPQIQQNIGWRDVYTPFRQEPQRLSLPGFYISSPQDIAPRDVPMDGSISFFPSNDLSYIIIKQWTGNGTIAEAKYVIEPQNSPPVQSEKNEEQDSEKQKELEPSGESEIVEVVSAALNEQTQRLTAAFSQIGAAFNSLQQKLDMFAPVSAFNQTSSSSLDDVAPENTEEKVKQSRPKAKEQKESEKS